MEDNNQWSKLNNEFNEVINKFQEKIEEEELVKDLQDSVFEITENTKNIFKSLSDTIESTVKDERIRLASKDLIQSIQEEFELTLKKSKKRISDYINTKDPLEEE